MLWLHARRRRHAPLAFVCAFALALGGLSTAAARGATGSPRLGLAYVTGAAGGPPVVWLADSDGRHARRLGPGSQPLLAPDGALVAASGASGLLVYPSAGGPPRRYFAGPAATATAVAFSPDSRYLAVALTSTNPVSDRASGLAVIDTTTNDYRILARGQIYGASFAPDGSDRIAYASATSPALNARVDIYEIGADGTGLAQITRDGRSLNPLWGPGVIAFDHERLRADAEPAYQVWITTSDGGIRHALSDLSIPPLRDGLVPIAFSEAGTVLLAEYVGQDTSQAWLLGLPAGRAERLAAGLVGAGLSRDGQRALVERGGFLSAPSHGVIETVPLAGGRPRVLVRHGSEPSWNA